MRSFWAEVEKVTSKRAFRWGLVDPKELVKYLFIERHLEQSSVSLLRKGKQLIFCYWKGARAPLGFVIGDETENEYWSSWQGQRFPFCVKRLNRGRSWDALPLRHPPESEANQVCPSSLSFPLNPTIPIHRCPRPPNPPWKFIGMLHSPFQSFYKPQQVSKINSL